MLRLLIQYRKGNGNSFALVDGGHRIMAILSLIYKFKKPTNRQATTTAQSNCQGVVNTKELCRKASLFTYVPIFKMMSDESRTVDIQKRLTRFSICQFFNTLSSAIQSQSTSAQKLSMKQLLYNIIGTTNMIGIDSASINDSNSVSASDSDSDSDSNSDSVGDKGGMAGIVSYNENHADIGIENALATACYICFRAGEGDRDFDKSKQKKVGLTILENIGNTNLKTNNLPRLASDVKRLFLDCDDKILKSK